MDTRLQPYGPAAKRSYAQAIVEFALVMPVLLVLVLGLFDFGRAYVFGVAVQQGARESARAAMYSAGALDLTGTVDDLGWTDPLILKRLIDASKPSLQGCVATANPTTCTDSFGVVWTLTVTPAGDKTALGGTQVEVRAAGSMPLFVGFLTGLVGLSVINIQGDAKMMII